MLLIIFVSVFADESDVIYDDSQILEFYITFEDDEWYDMLYGNYLLGSEDENDWIYSQATFTFNGVDYDSVGVRFKGYKSMGYPTQKKPFKIKFDAFVEDQEFYSLDKLNLNNNYCDPSFLREKLVYDVMNEYIPSSRANFAKVYVNGIYWGLYTNVEQVNMKFVDRHYGGGEDGNLFKGDPHGDLVWYGPNQADYYDLYEIKTNEELNNWSDLLNLIDIVNNTPANEFAEDLKGFFHIHNYLFYQVINNYYVNLDSYFGNSRNYYLYHRTDTNKFTHIPWDFNYAFGVLKLNILDPDDILHLDMFWEYSYSRPFYTKTIATQGVDEYKDIYKMIYKYLAENELNETFLSPHIDELADLIRDAVYADNNKMFTNEEFETNLENDINFGNNVIFGLKHFIQERDQFIESQLQNYIIQDYQTGIYINEVMAMNTSTITDEFGEYADWIEIYNSNDVAVNLEGLFLSDNSQTSDKWQFPDVTIPANDYLIIWADNDALSGILHANFGLKQEGEFIGIYNKDAVVPIDCFEYPALLPDVSYGRNPDGSANLQIMSVATPSASNDFVLLGDVDRNGMLQAYDASLTLRYSIGLIELDEFQITNADVDENGYVQSMDASLILQYVLGIIDEF